MIEAFAPAKINLTLHITGQRDDGYHLMDSLVVFVDVGDRVTVEKADQSRLEVSGPRAIGVPTDDSNLVVKAARMLRSKRGARIHLEKHLPSAAGIGGGSSDAAATLRALAEFWDVPMPRDTTTLGADLPVCVEARPMRMRGIGEVLSPINPLPECWLVLVNPGVGVSTPEVFRRIENKTNPAMGDFPDFASVAKFTEWLATTRNDMQPAAISIEPIISDVLTAIEAQKDCLLGRMSGSGATCWGLFATQEAANIASQAISRAHPDWWCVATKVDPLS